MPTRSVRCCFSLATTSWAVRIAAGTSTRASATSCHSGRRFNSTVHGLFQLVVTISSMSSGNSFFRRATVTSCLYLPVSGFVNSMTCSTTRRSIICCVALLVGAADTLDGTCAGPLVDLDATGGADDGSRGFADSSRSTFSAREDASFAGALRRGGERRAGFFGGFATVAVVVVPSRRLMTGSKSLCAK